MNAVKRPVFKLKDYKPTPYEIKTAHMNFILEAESTLVTTTLELNRRANTKKDTPLILVGDELELIRVSINDIELHPKEFTVNPNQLKIYNPPCNPFKLEIITKINPKANRQLMGLYQSNDVFCTQCEAEGFRRITYFYDRPDVLCLYTIRMEANKKKYPILLSNGNCIETGNVDKDRHFAIWHDPFPKPSYLFALVAGNLEVTRDKFKTKSGKIVELGIYVEKGKKERALYAMDSLKRSFAFDEKYYGREYDLDIFNIVAVSDFNMGAMENKGLNIFNDRYILASAETETDADFANVERVVAHEYFHNWTGNRITCRDWFQLCLKEGLTVYRDQEFSSTQRSKPVQRIEQVRLLKIAQFPEDSGPLSHPVRPTEYREINNFYTTTIYEKGAEVIRMIHTLLGDKLFRKGMDLYFERHDGQACTIEDFIACFAEISQQDFTQFMLWYQQAGTPQVTAKFDYNEKKEIFTIKLKQKMSPTPGQNKKHPMVIPIRFALLGKQGQEIFCNTKNNNHDNLLLLKDKKQNFYFNNIKTRPVVSLLRDFSAPVILKADLSKKDLYFLAAHDQDPVNRWQALNDLLIDELVYAHKNAGIPRYKKCTKLAKIINNIASDKNLEPAYRAIAITVPNETEIARIIAKDINPDYIHTARKMMIDIIAKENLESFNKLYTTITPIKPYTPDSINAGKRALANTLLHYIVLAENSAQKICAYYKQADNMTDRLAALNILVQSFNETEETQSCLNDFEKRFDDDVLTIDKWFSIQARSARPETLEKVKELTKHKHFSFENPNRVRALIGTFASTNTLAFNRVDGASYNYLATIIINIDKKNPQLAARLLTTLRSWRSLEKHRRHKLENALKLIVKTENLSNDVNDIIVRLLNANKNKNVNIKHKK